MGRIILTLLFAIQVSNGQPPTCCGSKTVGEYSYTLVKTEVNVPTECKNSCAYSRDDQEGSLYCFAKGDLAVECTDGEKPVETGPCYPGPPGPTGCPPDQNLRIIDAVPASVSNSSSLDKCMFWCETHCQPNNTCECNAWSYDNKTETCYTYNDYPVCYNTIEEDGWVTGVPCYDTPVPNEYQDLSALAGNPIRRSFGPYGRLATARKYFNGYKAARGNGPIRKIVLFTKKYNGINDVIVGIQVDYKGGSSSKIGDLTGTPTQCISPDIFGTIKIQSTQSTREPYHSLIYHLEFFDSGGTSICAAGNSYAGFKQTIRPSPQLPQLWFMYGYTTDITPPTLGKIYFYYQDPTA